MPTLSLPPAEIEYLRKLVAVDIFQRNQELYSPDFINYGYSMRKSVFDELALGLAVRNAIEKGN